MPREISLTDLGSSYEELEQTGGGQRRRMKDRRGRHAYRRIGPAGMRPADHDWVYLHGINPWSMAEHARAMMGVAPCPVCGGGELRLSAYCLGCDSTGADGVIAGRFPGLPVAMSDRLDCPPAYLERPAYCGTGALKGGKGV